MRRTRVLNMGRTILLGVILSAVSVGGRGAVVSGETAKDPFDAMAVHRPVEPFPAPDLTFRSPDGREVRLRDLRGKVLLLGFFRTD